jgi:serine/threonine protein kinase
MKALLNNPDFRKTFISWIESSLADGSNLLATSNQGTLLLYQQAGNQCVVKAAMGKAAVYQARLATLRREFQAYEKMRGIENIPECYGFLAEQYMVLEYIPGSPYRHASWQHRDQWFAQFQQTIEAFHKKGVAHGDLKSKSNIIVTEDEKPCVIDFGTAIIFKPGFHPINHRLFKFASRIDRNAWVKHKYHGNYDAASETDKNWLQYSLLEKVLRKFRRRG